MKAIIITFNGEFNSPEMRDDAIRRAVQSVYNATSASLESVQANLLEDKEVAIAIVNSGTMSVVNEETEVEAFAKFCEAVIARVGVFNPDLEKDFMRNLTLALYRSTFTRVEIEILKNLINKKLTNQYREILRDYHLEKLPEILKKLNVTLKLGY